MQLRGTGETPFQEAVEKILDIVFKAIREDWQRLAELDSFADLVYLKNGESVLVHVNSAYRDYCSPNNSPVGRSSESVLDKTIIDVSKQTDLLILGGSNSLDCEHVGRAADGRLYAMRTHKQDLAPLGNPGLAILGVTRAERLIENASAHPRAELAEQYHRFGCLDYTDREICRQIGRGKKVREIADQLELTSRAVEQRKRKILEALELDQTLDLVKLLVRLQDRGFVDLGL